MGLRMLTRIQATQRQAAKVREAARPSRTEAPVLDFPYTPAQQHIFKDSRELGRFRIFPKGRRLGATQGGAWAVIEAMLEGKHVLWGDTINGNIRRYIERYFIPAMRARGINYTWRKQDNALEVGTGYTDFRSADKPENWEGFGYDLVFLNEAGIILDDPYLWHNAVLPMMIDREESTLIAAGTPKLSSMTGLLFRDLWEKAQAGEPGYHGRRFSTFDNPHLPIESIHALEGEINPAERPQEIEGQFITPDNLGSFFKREWFPILGDAPEFVRKVRGWDFAATEPGVGNEDPDWTVGVGIGITAEGQMIIHDVAMQRTGPAGVDALLARTAKRDGPDTAHVVPVDPGAAGKTAAQHFTNHPLDGYPVIEYPQTRQQGSKAARATPASIAASEHQFQVVHADWNDWFFGQLTPFPNPKVHDDATDALAAAYNAIVNPGTTDIETAESYYR